MPHIDYRAVSVSRRNCNGETGGLYWGGNVQETTDALINNYDPATDTQFTVADDDIKTINAIDWEQV